MGQTETVLGPSERRGRHRLGVDFFAHTEILTPRFTPPV